MINRRNIPIFLLWLSCCFLLCYNTTAQETLVSTSATVDRNQVLIGEQIKLNIELQKPASLPVAQWFNIPDTFNHLEVVERKPVDSSLEGSIKTYIQQFTITGFDSGVWNIPSFPVTINNRTYNTQPLSIAVVPVQLKDSTYHDIREIIEVPPPKTPWWYWLAGIFSLIVIGLVTWLWLRARKRLPAINAVTASARLTALQEAIEKLRQLQHHALPEKGEWKKYYSSLTEIVKGYSHKRFGLPAMQFTTDELLVRLPEVASKETLGHLAEALRVADAVKFAKYQPLVTQADVDIKNIEDALHELERIKQ